MDAFASFADSPFFIPFLNLNPDNFKTLFNANTETDKDSIIPESVRYSVMRDHGLTKRNAIIMVMLSTFVLVVIFAFLILGMTIFAEGDAFSSAISSLLGATAGVVNIISSSREDDSKLKRLASRLLETWSAYAHNNAGVSLNDNLRDAVMNRSKYIQQHEMAERAEQPVDAWYNPVSVLKSSIAGRVKAELNDAAESLDRHIAGAAGVAMNGIEAAKGEIEASIQGVQGEVQETAAAAIGVAGKLAGI